MGHNAQAIVVYVGLARLPQPLVSSAASIAVELAVELCSRCIVAAHTNLPFPGLDRLLRELLVGKAVDTLDGRALLELEVRYGKGSKLTGGEKYQLVTTWPTESWKPGEWVHVFGPNWKNGSDGGWGEPEISLPK